jgi:tetratricopeptide (TPR) repeat protein
LNPNYPLAHHWYAVLLGNLGRYDEAIQEARRAQDLDPLSPNIGLSLALAYILARQPDLARAELERVLEMEPGFAAAHSVLGFAHERSGKYQEAIDEYQRTRELQGDNPFGVLSLEMSIARVYARLGNRAEALKALAKTAGRPGVSQYLVAEIHAVLGDRSRVLESLDRAYEAHDLYLLNVKVNPDFEGLHGDAKFDELVRRVGLTP